MRNATSHAGMESAAGLVAQRFADFYRLEYDRAVRLAWLLTGSQAAAEDVVQDAMTGVYRLFERLDAPGAYLHRAVVNGARSRSRDERRQRERVARLEREGAAVDVDDAGLLELISGLPYRQRVVIVGRYWAGWSEADIARALGCRRGTVKLLASRALNRLRQELEP
ncbi:MAG: sigma-70 family RNA polymerase sigma factor [Sciscionella sp.]